MIRTSLFRISRALSRDSDASFIEFEFRPGELFPRVPLAARLNMGGVCICSLFADTHCFFVGIGEGQGEGGMLQSVGTSGSSGNGPLPLSCLFRV